MPSAKHTKNTDLNANPMAPILWHCSCTCLWLSHHIHWIML